VKGTGNEKEAFMNQKISLSLSGVPETLLITLYQRAQESQRPDAMLKDEKAVEIVRKLEFDFARIKLQKHDILGLVLRVREFDRFARGFLAAHPEGVVVHIGCGLDTRFERVDNGRVEWFDLDLPEVIDLRRKLIRDEGGHYHLLSCSVFDAAWIQKVSALNPRPFLFIGEGIFPYFKEQQIKSLILKLQATFPGAELVFDAHTPWVIHSDNLQLILSKVKARLHFSLKHGRDVETWGDGIHMLEEWFYFGTDEPRIRKYRWIYNIAFLRKSTGIFHYRLGTQS
jgi:O-methyltransferase involved in polyketide biosynthesis